MSALAFCPPWPYVHFVNCPPALCDVFIVGLIYIYIYIYLSLPSPLLSFCLYWREDERV